MGVLISETLLIILADDTEFVAFIANSTFLTPKKQTDSW